MSARQGSDRGGAPGPAVASMLVGCEITGNVDVLSDEDVASRRDRHGHATRPAQPADSQAVDMQVERGTDLDGHLVLPDHGHREDRDRLPGLDVERVGEYYRLEVELAGHVRRRGSTGDLTVVTSRARCSRQATAP